MRSRDVGAASALRSALAAIDNAEAIPVSEMRTTATTSPHYSGGVEGVGAAEAQRRGLTERQTCEVIEAEIAERVTAATIYKSGHPEQASRLRREARVLSDVMEQGDELDRPYDAAGCITAPDSPTRSGRSRGPCGDLACPPATASFAAARP